MFYSHEILTSRQYGVATVWLVATLGAKSTNTKKITRKAILDVNVKKACATIIQPEAPMALRLQSNLLYGVSRVYDQQCYYVLQDAQSAQNAIRALIRSSRNNQLDATAGKARPEQLMLLDDPAFLPEFPLPALDFDFDLDLDKLPSGDARSTQSMMSIRARSGSVSSSYTTSALGLNLPPSSGNNGYQLPGLDPFGNSPIPKDYGGLGREAEEEFMDNDNIFAFNEDGELLDGNEAEREQLRAGAILTAGHVPSDSAASGRVRQEHEDGQAALHQEGDGDVIMYGDDDAGILPDAEPFDLAGLPVMAGALGGNDVPQRHSSQDRVLSEVSSDSAQARQVARKTRSKKLLIDKQLEIKSSEMKIWQTDYLKHMASVREAKLNIRRQGQAKKNAFQFVFGGLNSLGGSCSRDNIAAPLEIFSGESLRTFMTGKPSATKQTKKGKKRDAEEDISPSAKRARDSEQGRGKSPDPLHAFDDDGVIVNMEDERSQSVELGRDAASALAEYPSSALMPWNKSASLLSHQRNVSSQRGRSTQIGSGLGLRHRHGSSSPLVGRGTHLSGDIDQMMFDEDVPLYGREDDEGLGGGFDFGVDGGENSSQGVRHNLHSQLAQSNDDFEIFGQAANVDTQTAGTSQWVRDALDKESNNFFEYVKNTIEEKQVQKSGEKGKGPTGDNVSFEELFKVENNSSVVAAQAFYHVLCLATKRRVWVEQDLEEDEHGAPAPFGQIRIGVVEAV